MDPCRFFVFGLNLLIIVWGSVGPCLEIFLLVGVSNAEVHGHSIKEQCMFVFVICGGCMVHPHRDNVEVNKLDLPNVIPRAPPKDPLYNDRILQKSLFQKAKKKPVMKIVLKEEVAAETEAALL